MAKDKGGRPTVMTKDVIRLLETAFLAGCTDLEACCYADIGKTSLYQYCEKNPEFTERKETLKNKPLMQARFIIKDALVSGDLNTANRVIDRKEGQKIVQQNTNVELTHEQWLDTLE